MLVKPNQSIMPEQKHGVTVQKQQRTSLDKYLKMIFF